MDPYDLEERKQQAAASLAAREAEFQQLQHGFRREEVAQAEARYQQLLAENRKAVDGPRTQEIEVARSQLRVAQARLVLAQQNHERMRNLAEKRAAAMEELDRAGKELESATANVTLREQQLDLLLDGTRKEDLEQVAVRVEEARQAWELTKNGYRQEEIDAARAARDAARFALQAIERQMDELNIVATVDGVIEALELEPGDLVAPSAPVISLLDDQHIWVRTYVPQNRLSVMVGQPLTVTVDSFPGERFAGTVSFVSRLAEFTPSNVQTPEERAKLVFRMKVALENRENRLRPGMSVDVWLPDTEPNDE